MTQSPKPAGRRVLIAAAQQQVRSFLAVLLADRGFVPAEAADGPALLEALRCRPPAAAVIDLPISSDWVRRSRQAAPDVPLILIGDGHDLTPEEAVELIDGYLDRPVRPDELLFTLHRLLREQDRGGRLRHAQRIQLLGRLTGGVVHDLNNLVTVMLGRSEMLLDAGGDSDAVLDHAAQIREAASRASSLTRRLLAFSRRQKPRRVRLSINSVVADMSRLLRSTLPAELDVRLDLDPAVGDVEGDLGELEQVVMNLVLNARDAITEKAAGERVTGHRLTLRTFSDELIDPCGPPEAPASPAAVLAVRDTGCGMSAAVRARLFEPFFTTKPPGRGTGLGTGIVADIVRRCGGRIEVDSEEGHGTEFRVLLPLARGAADSGAAAEDKRNTSSARIRNPQQGTETVLLAEDNEQVAALTASVLRGCGYSVVVAGDGVRAVEVGQAQPRLDLLVTDLGLPGLSGRAVAECLREARPGLKVLFISGEARPIGRFDETGGLPLLEKPFTPDDLAQRVRQVLDG